MYNVYNIIMYKQHTKVKMFYKIILCITNFNTYRKTNKKFSIRFKSFFTKQKIYHTQKIRKLKINYIYKLRKTFKYILCLVNSNMKI